MHNSIKNGVRHSLIVEQVIPFKQQRISMNTQTKILGTDEAWDNGILGNEEKYVGHLSDEELLLEEGLINASLGLQPISIRLEVSLIEAFKAIATIHGLRYQTLMRQALKRFADCEMKRITQDRAEEIRAKQKNAISDLPS